MMDEKKECSDQGERTTDTTTDPADTNTEQGRSCTPPKDTTTIYQKEDNDNDNDNEQISQPLIIEKKHESKPLPIKHRAPPQISSPSTSTPPKQRPYPHSPMTQVDSIDAPPLLTPVSLPLATANSITNDDNNKNNNNNSNTATSAIAATDNKTKSHSSSPTTLIKHLPHPHSPNSSKQQQHSPNNNNNNSPKHHHSPIVLKQHSLATTPQVDSYSISKISQARERVKRSFDRSKLLSEECEEYIYPRFDWSELVLGDVLGKGGFGTVLEIQRVKLMEVEEEKSDGGVLGRLFDDVSVHTNNDKGATNRGGGGGSNLGNKKRRSSSSRLMRRRTDGDAGREDHVVSGCKSMDQVDDILHDDDANNQEGQGKDATLSPVPPLPTTGTRTRMISKTLSWSNARAHAHDVTNFFHRPHHHDKNNCHGVHEKENETKEDNEGPLDVAEGDTGNNNEHHAEGGRHKLAKALSWSNAKAHAHDVTNFFHLPIHDKHPHHGDEEGKEVSNGGKDGSHDAAEGTNDGHDTNAQTQPHPEGRRHKLSKALSWTPRAHAHDVAQFFHRHHHHHNRPERIEEEDSNITDESVTKDMYSERQREERKKQVSCDDRLLNRSTPASHNDATDDVDLQERKEPSSKGGCKRIPRNFSFQAWRNSEAGEEGNDAIPQEEYERISRRNTAVEKDRSSDGHSEDGEQINDCMVFIDCPGYDGLNVDDYDEKPASDEMKELVVPKGSGATNNNRRRRRIIVFSNSTESPKAEEESVSPSLHQDKQFITNHTTTTAGNARYAIKVISPDIVQNDFKKFLQAAMDMATETYFLSVLNHPHILKMRAVGQGDMFSPQYFLVLDRLYDTLEDRIEDTWKPNLDGLENHLLVWNRWKKIRMLWEERMGVAKDLASALLHLHDLGIIYRDIKPENVGFDSRGVVKLFDFGLAKEVYKEDESAGGTYKLTANTGSLRYMAPEVGNKWPYNFFADSYSFGIMLWEVAALQKPFANYSQNELRDMVMRWGERPKVKDDWSDRMKQLMQNAWDSNFRKRPTMKEIVDTLDEEIKAEHV